MIKMFKYLMVLPAIIGSYLVAPPVTTYFPGVELENGTRHDTILVGGAGGFSGFTQPSSKIKALYIEFVQSGTTAVANTTHTYTGGGTVPHLPTTLQHLWIGGDALGFNTLMETDYTLFSLPTPAVGTIIHFALTRQPAARPAHWFQYILPAACKLVVEPASADPYILSAVPVSGGTIVLGSNVTVQAGFNTELNSAVYPCTIQRHPNIAASDAHSKARLTISENTTFPWAVNGISLNAGESCASTFLANSDLVDPTAAAAVDLTAGSTDAICTLSLYAASADLPTYTSTVSAGSKVVVATSAPKLPSISLYH
ncbi:MAG: hypothetical protein WCJ92_05445 [Alphaproteobacteria bacterium]